ncbi:MAG: TonB-dependent receptor plug domain-containing protein [Bacteroides sp.]|nr:TonB-dependent receptor plug domain-containing protein [Bacteroides sp.]
MKNLLSRFVLLTLLVMSGWTTMLFAQAINVSGTVVDAETDEPLIGATVRLKGVASKGCTTDVDGNFSFTGILPEAVLEVSYVGYKNQTISVNGMKRLTIKLLQNSEQLNEVVVIGYGTMDKKELTSSISHINEKDFLKSTSLDVSMMIQGKVPSVSITNTGAADPNNQASIQIRGVSSRSAGTGPLIVIDGIPGGNLTNINPNDIASFDILKDGAAAAIYGTRGSNGVILVTTKKGTRDGQIHTSYMGTVSASVANHELDMLTAKQYRALRIPGGYGNDLGGNDDWLDAVTRTGWMHQHTLSLSGGNNKNNYRVSIDYRKAEGVDLYSSREEYGGRAGIQQTTRNGLFTFTANVAPRLIKP